MTAQPETTSEAVTAKPQTIVGFDTETFLIAPGAVAPKIVCLSVAGPTIDFSDIHVEVIGNGDQHLDLTLGILFEPDSADVLVAHNAPFDLAVIAAARPDLIPAIFQALEDGRVSDTIVREKLLNLALTGDIENVDMPDGSKARMEYTLARLAKDYLGVDLSDEKDTNDAWRTNYSVFDGVPTSEWPQDAIAYAANDAVYAREIWQRQEDRRLRMIAEIGHDPFQVESFRNAANFALFLMTCWGVRVDLSQKAKILEMLEQELAPEKVALLVEAGILIPGSAPEPYANGAKDHRPDCPKGGKGKACDCPPKMKAATKERVNTNALKGQVLKLAKENPEVQLRYTAPSEKFPEGQLQVDAEFLDDYAHLDPVLEQYQHRQKLQKLVTTEMPRLNNPDGTPSEIVHPCYDVLKRTGRTSSYANKLFPSFNCQNVDPRVRGCYIPREGHWFASVDYSAMELVTTAQVCLNIFGQSVLADKLNAGVDPHAYLAAQMAYQFDETFREAVDDAGAGGDQEATYQLFAECRDAEDADVKAFFKHYRTFAKPTGLGYPGGLGPKTFVRYAKATFGVIVDEAMATQMREIWRATFPEIPAYLEWINDNAVDHRNGKRTTVDAEGKEKTSDRYWYVTPMGMLRSGCDYCAAANGKALQSPSAEGALLAVFNVVRAAYDPVLCSELYGVYKPQLFVHDQILGEVPADLDVADAIVKEKCRIMVESLRLITPDVQVRVEPALMERWDKRAEPVYDKQGRLTLWKPKEPN